MNDSPPRTLEQSLSVATEHGLLHATLDLAPGAPGIIVLAHAARALDGRDEILAGRFREAGFSTLNADLVSLSEEHFPDIQHNVPLLCKRLLDFLGLIKHRVQHGEIPAQPFGLYAADVMSPVIIRVAALRDHDIAALVCRGGLIDLAGMIYLRSLESPLLMLAEDTDTRHIASARRALREIPCDKELAIIPEVGIDAASPGFEQAAQEATEWFAKFLRSTSTQQ